ncbi:MAG: type II toxin-antitoxin system RelE/ParE family toxin [Bryobacterales bacterium]|nr:type II toxin-antitoxin system RelE/ParE family toxin [Bryobacterales bacterium]
MKHVIRPAAKDDILRQFRYFSQKASLEIAARFLDAVDESIAVICRMPQMGAPKILLNPVTTGLRSWPVNGFEDILIFYVVQPDALRVIRILHGARDIGSILDQEKLPGKRQ